MADPLSITASLLAISTAAIQTVKSLCEATRRYKGRDKTLGRLQDELNQLTQILESLARTEAADESLFLLLKGPIARCTQVCQEFETSMGTFIKNGKAGFLDWAKMEFRRGDINEFIATIAVYKSTISVGLGTITLLVNQESLQAHATNYETQTNFHYLPPSPLRVHGNDSRH
jgi:hypothetical protein